MGEFVDNPSKATIRNVWCRPVLEYIHEHLGYDLVYFGLPGLDAIDLYTWIDFIKYVIAIDCGHYTEERYDIDLARKNIEKLNEILNRLEREEKLTGYSLYLGYIEEIILKGIDKNGREFTQKDAINIYNLDFCNALTVPLKIVSLDGEVKTYYKNEVIRKLLEFERDIEKPNSSKRFIMFITVHTNFWEDEARKYFEYSDDEAFFTYRELIRHLSPYERKVRLLRYYLIHILKTHFTASSFSPYFLPTLLYEGSGDNQLMCFTIIGKYTKQASSVAPFTQCFSDLTIQKFLSPIEGAIRYHISAIKEKNSGDNPITHIRESKFFV